ncbi:MAG TPA: M23 family metallopeptidase [Lentimicrobium sp.]|nr:M23 family metallopeptidase [Lentimicrobium sp.]
MNKEPRTISPVSGRIIRRFGTQRHPITGKTAFHNGVDIACPVGTTIIAPEDGLVLDVWEDQKGGLSLSIISYDCTRFGFAHLSKQLVRKGEELETGQPIALSGNTGLSTGPHLHLTVKKYGVFVDPVEYFDF